MVQEEIKQKEFEQLQDKLTPHIEHIVLKFFIYFSQYFRAKEYKPFDLSGIVTVNTQQEIVGTKIFDQFMKKDGTANQLLLANGNTTDIDEFLPKNYSHVIGQMTIEPNDDIRNQGLRFMKNKANWDSFVLTGCIDDPANRDGVWKMGSTSSQFRIQKQEDETYDHKGVVIDFDCTSLKFNNQLVVPLPTPPIEYEIKQTLAYGMYEQLVWGSFTTYNGRAYLSVQVTHNNPFTQTQSTYTLFSVFKDETKPQFTETPFNIPLNAVMFAQKVLGYPICWNGAIPIDCYIDVDGHVRINTMCQLSLPDNFCVQICDSYALHNQSS